jgi:hypothetical protein
MNKKAKARQTIERPEGVSQEMDSKIRAAVSKAVDEVMKRIEGYLKSLPPAERDFAFREFLKGPRSK